MMASQQTKLHDPMYNFDTHFPERLSRLHLHGDITSSGSFRKKKGRGHRTGARYKTQPVTFDEIKEVDEEPTTPGTTATAEKDSKSNSADHIMGQLQAFSKSIDVLIPKGAISTENVPVSHSRSGSRKFQRHPNCIPERAEAEQQPVSPDVLPQQRLLDPKFAQKGETLSTAGKPMFPVVTPRASLMLPGDESKDNPPAAQTVAKVSPIPSPNIAPRRQKVTAKAKKRQKAHDDIGAASGT